MRSKITKLLANIAISLSIFVSSIPVIAVKGLAFDAPIPANAFLEESNTLQQFRASLEVDLLFSKAVPLNDSNQNPRYYYMPFAQGGYLIYDLTEDLVCEFSLLKENEYSFSNNDYIYSGPLSLFEVTEDGFIDVKSNEIFNDTDNFIMRVKSIEKRELESKQSILSDESIKRITNAYNTTSGTVPSYSYNPDGRCGAVAAAMMVRWYDIYRNGRYVPSSLESSDGVSLINHLWNKMKNSSYTGAYSGTVYTEMMNYLGSQGVNHSGGLDGYTNEYVIGRVDSYGTPYILNLFNHPTYSNHFVTGYGYCSNSTGFYTIVNDGWGNRGIEVNSNYATTIIW